MKKQHIYYCILAACCLFFVHYFQQDFVELYMRYALRNSNIVVSLSTTPYRINKIANVIESIEKQTAPLADIYLSIPYVFKRDNIEYKIPQFISENKNITILRTEDYGPATKLLGLLSKVKLSPNTIIVTLDDDIKYAKNIVLHLAYNALINPEYTVGLSGTDLLKESDEMSKYDRKLGLKTRYNFQGKVTVLQGYAGIAYKYHFFDQSIFELAKLPDYCTNSDDLLFAFYLESKHIPRMSIANQYINTYSVNSETDLATNYDALQKQIPSPPEKHRACLKYLNDNFPEVAFN